MINNIIDVLVRFLDQQSTLSVIKPLISLSTRWLNGLMNKIKQLQFITITPNNCNPQIWIKIVQRSRNYIRETPIS